MRSVVVFSFDQNPVFAERLTRAHVEVERHDDRGLLAAVDEDRRLAGVSGARDDLAKDVTSLGDLGSALGAGRGHATTVADLLRTSTPRISVLSYDGYQQHRALAPP